MSDWLRRLLGILALGGGAIGCTVILTTLFTELPISSKVILLLFLPIYAWGIWCGVQMIERHEDAIHTNFVFWAIQIPIVQSSVISYMLTFGLLGGVWLQFSPAKINFLAWLGSRFDFGINQPKPFAIGINIVAVAACLILWRIKRTGRATQRAAL